MAEKKIPMRTCIACRQEKPKREMLRVVKNAEGEIRLDFSAPGAGRLSLQQQGLRAEAEKIQAAPQEFLLRRSHRDLREDRGGVSWNEVNSPHISALPEEAVVRPGDYIMTSGTAGVYPSGIPVGVVKTVQEGEITVDLFEKSDNLEFVRVIDYGSTVLLPDSCTEEPTP